MFLLQWGTSEAIQRFEEVSGQTFGKSKALLARILQLVVAYVEDGQYSLSAVQEAFRKTFNSPLQMFNPLRNDTKVAVTTTAVDDSLPWLFTNYNGGKRPSNIGYGVVRAEQAHNDITVSDAACCTSAAPYFFRPQAVRSLGIFQDGGLQHNNPASIAQWEARFIWPSRPDPDFMLSLGTGIASATTNIGMLSKPRFLKRLLNSFMRNLNGEDAWKRFYNSVPINTRHKYHRLNVQFTEPEPSLNDAIRIPELKASVPHKIQADPSESLAVLDAMISTMFYFELDGLPTVDDDGYTCSGYIFCRLDLPQPGLHRLYKQLVETSSWFLIQGNPIICVQCIPQSLPPFKRRIKFHVDASNDPIAFSIRGITSTPQLLSGFPTTLAKLIEEQHLDSPFGTIDHIVPEKPLPAIPQKRSGVSRHQKIQRTVKRARARPRGFDNSV